jgi:homoserine kinase
MTGGSRAGGPATPGNSAGRPRVVVEVPASTANLGPGFDALGLALGLHNRVEVDVVNGITAGARATVEVTGEGADRLPTDEKHLVVRAIQATLEALGATVPGLAVRSHNRIPHCRGLGSSAAAAVAGVAAGYALAGIELTGTERATRALDVVAAFEGHADNAAPSLLGGLTIVWAEDPGGFRAVRLEPHPRLVPVLLVPAVESSTAHTRGLLPPHVPRADATFNVARTALLLHALTAAPELLLAATEDRLHQPYRRGAYPATAALVDALRARGVAAAVSGAGPTVLALTGGDPLPADVDLAGFQVCRLPVDACGVRVEITG